MSLIENSERVNNFSILEKISESSTTAVYRAYQNVLDRTVLLKVLHKHLLRDKNLVARFTREAKACAILHSENIVQVYDLTEIDGAPTIVMEYVDGKSLEEMLQDRIYSEEFVIKVATAVLNALSYAQEKGIVHRDIKPANILVSHDGLVKVTDFGLAAVSDAPSLTMEGSLVGTPAYMSPEQARGEPVDGRTDLFSLGITLVEILTREKVLLGKSYAECINNIQNFQSESLDKFSDKFSPHMFDFLKRLLSPNKNSRFSSADQALDFLSAFVIPHTPFEESVRGKRAAKGSRRFATNKKKTRILFGAIGVGIIIAVTLFLSLHNPAGKDRITKGLPVEDSSAAARPAISTDHGTLDNAKIGSGISQPGRGSTLKQTEKTSTDKSNLLPNGGNVVQDAGPSSFHSSKESVVIGERGTPAVADSGYISLDCRPWADVYIDSEYVGKTPIAGTFRVPVGGHTVMYNNPFFVPIVKNVIVLPNAQSSVTADFLSGAGYIEVTVNPWGEIFVDDQKRGTTPIGQPIIVSSGIRKLRIHNPKFKDIEQNIAVKRGDTLKLDFNFLSEVGK